MIALAPILEDQRLTVATCRSYHREEIYRRDSHGRGNQTTLATTIQISKVNDFEGKPANLRAAIQIS
jgi:hypothetical protein